MNCWITLWTTLCLSPLASAQEAVLEAQLPVSWRPASFSNPTENGSEDLKAVVHYPTKPGQNGKEAAEVANRDGGYPVLVLLHGLGGTGPLMQPLGSLLARHGYIVVCTDTTSNNRELQAVNAGAFFSALTEENKRKESPFAGQLDMARAGITGHSMGGGNTAKVLTDNPGYKAGFCFAPWTTESGSSTGADYLGEAIDKIAVPIGILHGINDRVLPWQSNALSLYSALSEHKTTVVFWRLGEEANHVNVAFPASSRTQSTENDRAMFGLCSNLAVAFFDRFLRADGEAFAAHVDPESATEGVLEVYSNSRDKKQIRAVGR